MAVIGPIDPKKVIEACRKYIKKFPEPPGTFFPLIGYDVNRVEVKGIEEEAKLAVASGHRICLNTTELGLIGKFLPPHFDNKITTKGNNYGKYKH